MIDAIRTGLDRLPLSLQDSSKEWTQAIKTMLCDLGHNFGYQVGAGGVKSSYGEWLYDVTWMEYSRGYQPGLENRLVDAHLVAECEWGDQTAIKDDFEKLLLARASIRLMIYDGNQVPGSAAIAERLVQYVRNFNGSSAEDVWLLAAWERHEDSGSWSFRYFPIGRFTTQQQLF